MTTPTRNLTSKTVRGMQWTLGAAVLGAAVQVGYSAVMARLLDPEAFGLLAMGLVVLRFGSHFGSLGVGSALVQKQDLSEATVRAAFTASVLLSLLVFAIFWTFSPLVGGLFGSPEVVPIVRALAASFILTNLSVTAQSLLRRELRFRVLSFIEVLSYVFGYCITGIAMALTGFGVWSLVGATLAQSLVSAIALNVACQHSFRPNFSWQDMKPLYTFGGKVSLITFVVVLSSNLDTLVIGSVLGASALGLYNRGQLLVNLPLQKFSTSLSKVLFPAFSRVQNEPEKLRHSYLVLVGVAGSVLMSVGFGMAAAAPEIVSTILGPGWEGAIPIVSILAIAAPIHLLTHFVGVLLEAQARLTVKLVIRSVHLVALGLLFVLFSRWELVGYAIALLVAVVGLNVAYTVVVSVALRIDLRALSRAYLSALGCGILAALAIYWTSQLVEILGGSVGVVLLVQVASGATVLIAALLLGPQREAVRPILSRVLPSGTSGRVARYLDRWRSAPR